MREVGTYTFASRARSEAAATEVFNQVGSVIEGWIEGKGTETPEEEGRSKLKISRGGRVATLTRQRTEASSGRLDGWSLDEPVRRGRFRTSVRVARRGRDVVFHCVMELDVPLASAPKRQPVMCPGFVRQVLEVDAGWTAGGLPVPSGETRLRGRQGGERLAKMIFDEERAHPLVVVSEQEGFALHPDLVKHASYDLLGLAVVISIDDEASWAVTRKAGREWSCFNGAVRIYWPITEPDPDPSAHWLWTAYRLLRDAKTVHKAETAIRRRLRGLLFEASAFSGSEPAVFSELRAEAERERIASIAERSAEDSEWKELADEYSRDNAALRGEYDRLKEELKAAESKLWRLSAALEGVDVTDGGASTGGSTPPQTVAEAVQDARERCIGEIVFGDDVDATVKGLADGARPPDKLLAWLETLARCARHRRANETPGGIVKWLNANGVRCSGEGKTVRNSKAEMAKRTWDDGAGNRVAFETHLKVKEGTSPDECVRVYFEWDDERKMMIVGSVGRHP